jgi:hypothetical protein
LNRVLTFLLRLVLISLSIAPNFCLAKDDGFRIEIDPQLPDTGSTTVWMGYLLARAKYREDHKIPLPSSGEIVPSFQEEVYAREYGERIYQEWKGENKSWSEPYWELLSEIKTKGFLEAYVWTYLRRPNWPERDQPQNIATFQSWSNSVLKNHKVQTHGSLVLDRK